MNASTARFASIGPLAAALLVAGAAVTAGPASARDGRVGASAEFRGGTVVGTARLRARHAAGPRSRVWIVPPPIFAPLPFAYRYPYPYPYAYPWGYPYRHPYAYPYGYPYGYPAPPGFAPGPAEPPEYVEREPQPDEPAEPAQAPPQPGYWYWCTDPQGYYPTVRECPQGWLQVAPQPPEQPRSPR